MHYPHLMLMLSHFLSRFLYQLQCLQAIISNRDPYKEVAEGYHLEEVDFLHLKVVVGFHLHRLREVHNCNCMGKARYKDLVV